MLIKKTTKMNAFSIIQISTTSALFLLIWFVQILHYPIFSYIDDYSFNECMKFHQNTMSYLAIPLMVTELFLSIYSAYHGYNLSYTVLAIVILIWLTTFFIQVPLHKRLLHKKDKLIIKRLVHTNWIRTILWSVKSIIIFNLGFK